MRTGALRGRWSLSESGVRCACSLREVDLTVLDGLRAVNTKVSERDVVAAKVGEHRSVVDCSVRALAFVPAGCAALRAVVRMPWPALRLVSTAHLGGPTVCELLLVNSPSLAGPPPPRPPPPPPARPPAPHPTPFTCVDHHWAA